MPRIHVNVQPSTIQFDDGESPIVSGAARFGAALAQMPAQMAKLRMEHAAADEDRRRFDLTHGMQSDRLKMEQQHYDNEDNDDTPDGKWTPIDEGNHRPPHRMLDAKTGEVREMSPGQHQPPENPGPINPTSNFDFDHPGNDPVAQAMPHNSVMHDWIAAKPGDEAYGQQPQQGLGGPSSEHTGRPQSPTGEPLAGPPNPAHVQLMNDLSSVYQGNDKGAQAAFNVITNDNDNGDGVRQLLAHDKAGPQLVPALRRYAMSLRGPAAQAQPNPQLDAHMRLSQPAPAPVGIQPSVGSMGMNLPSMVMNGPGSLLR